LWKGEHEGGGCVSTPDRCESFAIGILGGVGVGVKKYVVSTKLYVCGKKKGLIGIRMLESIRLSVICKCLPSRAGAVSGVFPCG
jgi:hypothetical protein